MSVKIDDEAVFSGSLFELTLSADRSYMLEEEGVSFTLSDLNFGTLGMGNGLTRLQTRFLADPEHPERLRWWRLMRRLEGAVQAASIGCSLYFLVDGRYPTLPMALLRLSPVTSS